ncbi:MAG: hypothetical protein HN390_06600 [Anaerolineae bacterium]|jgi:hypothetical protein|nr:hypothetical protein [Anaerolineae bacterium]MBT7188711.1 hypothetical protein [Anaerolineae bacterium]MBT7990946.1 hypothetical protein [Anaerolineae bacterium]
MKSQEVLPVLISILIIIAVAFLQRQSKLAAAIISTTPIRAALAIWVIYAAVNGSKEAVVKFNQSVALSLIPTFLFAVGAWYAARADMKIGGILLSGYGTWAIATGILYLLRQRLGIG